MFIAFANEILHKIERIAGKETSYCFANTYLPMVLVYALITSGTGAFPSIALQPSEEKHN